MKAFKILLWKAYFDKGWSITNYFKYIIFFVGLFDLVTAIQAFWSIVAYVIGCFIIGWAWYNTGLIETENEVNNVYNPFQREVREKLGKKSFK